MRFALAVAVAALVLPGAAAAETSRCRYYLTQIEHFEEMSERAKALDNELWEGRADDQTRLLKDRARAQGCDVAPEGFPYAKVFANLVRLAGKAALTYFTFGAL